MRINQIELTNFRSFAGAVVDLPTRVTFLIGRNHAGKSSVLDALKWALTGSCRGTAADGKGSDVLIRDATDISAMKVTLTVDDVGAEAPFTLERMQNSRMSTLAIGGLVGTRHDAAATLLDRLGVSPAVLKACLDSDAFLDLHHADAKRVLMEVLDVKVDVLTPHHIQGETRPISERLDLAEMDRRYDYWYRERPARKKALEAIHVPTAPEAGQLPDVAGLDAKLADLRVQEKARIAATATDAGRRQELDRQLAHAKSEIARIQSKRLELLTDRGVDLDDAIVALEEQIAKCEPTDMEAEQAESARLTLVDGGGRLRMLADTVQAVKTHSPDRGCVLNGEIECRTPAKEFKQGLKALQDQIDTLKTEQATATARIEAGRVRQQEQEGRQLKLATLTDRRRQRDGLTRDIETLAESIAQLQTELDGLSPASGPDAELLQIQERIRRGETVITDVRVQAAAREGYETAKAQQLEASRALAEAERNVELYGPKGARVAALETALDRFHARINEALLRFGYRLRVVPDPWLVLVNDRPVQLLSKSERLQAGIAVQLAIAEISGLGFVAIDQVDLFDAENRRAFGALLDATPVQVLAAMTQNDHWDPPALDDWSWRRLVTHGGITVVAACGEAVPA